MVATAERIFGTQADDAAASVAVVQAHIDNNFYRDGAPVDYSRGFDFQAGRTLAAEEANARTIAWGDNALNPKPPYAVSTQVVERMAQPGEKLYVVELKEADAPGMWAASKQYTSLEQARQELALLPEFKSGDLVVREYTVIAPTPVRQGTVGPLKSNVDGKVYSGGGTQTEFMFDVKNEWRTFVKQTEEAPLQ